MPPRRRKGARGASAITAAASKKRINAESKKNAKPLDKDIAGERQHEEEPIRGVTPPEHPNEDLPTMEARGKKQRKDCRIQDRAVEDSLVEFFRDNELLWNSQKIDYRNKAKRQRILETKAAELGIGVDHLWTWFKSLRDMYTRQVFMFKMMKMVQIIAMTLIIMEFIYLPYTYILTIHLPYTYHMTGSQPV